MDIVLKADKNVCEISGWQSNTGEVNARNLTVEMCEEMCSCAMAFVTFELNNGTIYESLVVESKAEIPEIKEPQFVKIGVYSADIENGKCVKRYSPHPTNAYINNGSYSGNGTEAPIPTAGTYAELLEKINNIVVSSGGIVEITEETYINKLENGIYRVDSESGATLYLDDNAEYALTDGIAIIINDEVSNVYHWLMLGLDLFYEPKTLVGVTVNNGNTYEVSSLKDLNTILTAEEIQKNIVEPVTEHITTLYGELGKKEDVSNKATFIDSESTNEQYASAKSVYDFGDRIIKEHREEVNEQIEDLRTEFNELIGGIENGSY